VLEWIVRRIEGSGVGVESPIGLLPEGLDVAGLDLDDAVLSALFDVPIDGWLRECALTEEFFARFGERLPAELSQQLQHLQQRLVAAVKPTDA
jgi:phosphoenolpyruvate carboxykinase (GTP)